MAPLNVTELCDIITQVLACVGIPVSFTLINTSLLSLLKMPPITEQFLIENNDKFSLQVIGSDLKISLRERDVKKVQREKVTQICSVIERDLRKLKEVEKNLKSEHKTEILYDDLISKYNSNKKSINIAFIVRNSHSLQMFCRNQLTYVRFVDKDSVCIEMEDEEIINILQTNGFDYILVRCLTSLLSNFFVPINLGSLQSCFTFGNRLINSIFLMRYREVFQNVTEGSVCCIELQPDARNEIDNNVKKFNKTLLCGAEANQLPDTESCYESKFAAIVSQLPETLSWYESIFTATASGSELTGTTSITTECELNDASKADKKELMSYIQNALKYNKSMVIVGEHDKEPLLIDLVGTDDSNRLLLLRNMQESINMEIQKLKE